MAVFYEQIVNISCSFAMICLFSAFLLKNSVSKPVFSEAERAIIASFRLYYLHIGYKIVGAVFIPIFTAMQQQTKGLI